MKYSNYTRLPKGEKVYWENQLQEFANRITSKNIKAVQFGKQDIRGTESITLINQENCVPSQRHFNNKWEMFGFIAGFNEAHEKEGSRIGRYTI